jgi:hypothetical protein
MGDFHHPKELPHRYQEERGDSTVEKHGRNHFNRHSNVTIIQNVTK